MNFRRVSIVHLFEVWTQTFGNELFARKVDLGALDSELLQPTAEIDPAYVFEIEALWVRGLTGAHWRHRIQWHLRRERLPHGGEIVAAGSAPARLLKDFWNAQARGRPTSSRSLGQTATRRTNSLTAYPAALSCDTTTGRRCRSDGAAPEWLPPATWRVQPAREVDPQRRAQSDGQVPPRASRAAAVRRPLSPHRAERDRQNALSQLENSRTGVHDRPRHEPLAELVPQPDQMPCVLP